MRSPEACLVLRIGGKPRQIPVVYRSWPRSIPPSSHLHSPTFSSKEGPEAMSVVRASPLVSGCARTDLTRLPAAPMNHPTHFAINNNTTTARYNKLHNNLLNFNKGTTRHHHPKHFPILSTNSHAEAMSVGGGGVTHSIREHLGFTDEKRWKEFSTRRLELIDKFNLSTRKASEQDDAIRQIANLLREEFGFSPETLLDFDKLVRAAIQSVRRNRKRSSRARVHQDRFVVYDEMGRPINSNGPHQHQHQHQQQKAQMSHSNGNNSTSSSNSNSNNNSTTNLASYGLGLNLNLGLPMHQSNDSAMGLSTPLSLPSTSAPTPSLFTQSSLQHPVITSSLLGSSLNNPPQVLSSTGGGAVNIQRDNNESGHVDTRVVINSLLSSNATTTISSTPSTSIATSPTSTQLPSIKALTFTPGSSSNPMSLNSTSASSSLSSKVEISAQTKQKLLNFIQKSKSCLMLSNNDASIHEDNLHTLGKSVTAASISFILERFFNDISSDSINYIAQKLQNVHTLSKVLKSLGFFSTDVLILTDTQASNLLCKLIGCCVKDFGFDGVSYTLGEIFHEIILNEYPLVATQVTKITPESLFTPMLPIQPKEADTEVMKDVKLRYGGRVLEFKYSPLSAAPPTYMELVENGRVAFGVQGKNLRLKFEGSELVDVDVAKLFKNLERRELEIELYEVRNSDTKFTPLL